jgi:hypothetical protein
MRLPQVSIREGILTEGYLYSHTGHSVIVHNGAAMEGKYTFDDAVAAAETLGEISAGYEEAAAATFWTAGAQRAEQPGTQGGCKSGSALRCNTRDRRQQARCAHRTPQ